MATHRYDLRPRHSPAPPNASTRCRLLELPPELRNHIYRLTLVEDSPIHLSARPTQHRRRHSKYIGWVPRNVANPPFLRTCRQVRSEALGMFYGLKVFQSVCSLVFGNWLTSIGPDNAKMVKQIRGYATDLVRSDRVFALSLASGHASVSVTGDPKGYQVGDGVFRAPFKDPERPEMIMWTTASSSVIYASKDDQHTVSMFKVESDAPLKLVPM